MRYNGGMVEQARKRRLWGWVLLLILVVVVTTIALNREWLYDYYRGMTYQPSSEMGRIRTDLKLTERGEFLFNASQPVLSESEEFNSYCREEGNEIAVLGCYTGGSIYVYNITDEELDGIRELTAAHELLHAGFARMSNEEKAELKPILEQVYAANMDVLQADIETYDSAEQFEELYVRVGTEVANLPEALEKHYAEVFKDQNAVVAYYDKYNGVFRALQTEMDGLQTEMETINATVEQKTAEYERRVQQLDADIVSFNSCAEVVGCFKSEEEFNVRRGVLVAEQEALESMYYEINGLIDAYNAKVEVYNADVVQGKKLNNMINSAAKPQEIE